MCPDWSCNKKSCKIRNNITTAFHYAVCQECKTKRLQKRCNTCIYGDKIRNRINDDCVSFICLKDCTIVEY